MYNAISEVTICAHTEMKKWRLGEIMQLCLYQASVSCQHWVGGDVCRAPRRMFPAVSCRRRTPWFRKYLGTDHASSSEEARSCLGYLHQRREPSLKCRILTKAQEPPKQIRRHFSWSQIPPKEHVSPRLCGYIHRFHGMTIEGINHQRIQF